jgi:sugar phosphate isomerase/epimerase
MSANTYVPVISANGYPYHQLGDSISLPEVMKHLYAAGVDGFDLLYGSDSFPRFDADKTIAEITDMISTAEECGKKICAVTLVSFDLASPDDCLTQMREGIALAHALKAVRLNLLPRKNGITHHEGFRRLETLWKEVHNLVAESGLIVSAENHTVNPDKDKDVFLIRDTQDLLNICNLSGGLIRLKYDPAWLCYGSEDPRERFCECLPYISNLDLKDFKNGHFVSPGTGLVPFEELFRQVHAYGRNIDYAVEVEEHLNAKVRLNDPDEIDKLHVSALAFYRRFYCPVH